MFSFNFKEQTHDSQTKSDVSFSTQETISEAHNLTKTNRIYITYDTIFTYSDDIFKTQTEYKQIYMISLIFF